MSKIDDKLLDDMIYSLKGYKAMGVHDPWLLDDGRILEPLDVLVELRELRSKKSCAYCGQPLNPKTKNYQPRPHDGKYHLHCLKIKEKLGVRDE